MRETLLVDVLYIPASVKAEMLRGQCSSSRSGVGCFTKLEHGMLRVMIRVRLERVRQQQDLRFAE